MSANDLAVIAGVVLSLLASYVPKFNVWFSGLDSDTQRLVMLGALVVATAGAFGLQCAALYDFALTCDKAGAIAVVKAFFSALVANQATYLISPKRK